MIYNNIFEIIGISSGAVLSAVKNINDEGKNIVVILPHSRERYLSNNIC